MLLQLLLDTFGGTLLGTGGLVKAYSDSLKLALEKTKCIQKEKGYEVEVAIGYEEITKFEKFCVRNSIRIIKKEYDEKIKILLEIEKEKYKKILKNNFQNIPMIIIKEKNITKNKYD